MKTKLKDLGKCKVTQHMSRSVKLVQQTKRRLSFLVVVLTVSVRVSNSITAVFMLQWLFVKTAMNQLWLTATQKLFQPTMTSQTDFTLSL